MSISEVFHYYSAYNLGIRSSLLLPELTAPAEAKEDITIRVNTVGHPVPGGITDSEYSYSFTESKARVHFTEVGTFMINNGREMTVFPLPNIEERLIRLPLLGAALAILLYQRGNFVLHASAVEVGGEAVAFIGDKGYGKSTMAAMMCSRGHRLLADDTVAINFDDSAGRYMVLPGFPQFKLYPDAVIATSGDDPEQLEEVASNVVKRSRRAESFCPQMLPLRAIYVLGSGAEVQINQVSPQEAIRFLIAHSYMARFSSDWLQSGIAASNFWQCAEIAGKVPVFMLERPRDLSILGEIAHAVEEQSAVPY